MEVKKAIQISAEGRLFTAGVEVKDQKFAKDFVSSFKKRPDHVCVGSLKDEEVLLEAKSFPLVVCDIDKKEDYFCLKFNYGIEEDFYLSESAGFYLDDWSRLCGVSKTGVPFLFSIFAQTKFLSDLVEVVDYNSIKVFDKEFEFEDWYIENKDVNEKDFWSERYAAKDTPWDKDQSHPCIKWVLPRLKLHKSKILVPGCGRGHDVAALAQLGHHVEGLDFSEKAIESAKMLYPKNNFFQADVFEFSKNHMEQYDVVFEHTLFCALDPAQRAKLIKAWAKILRPGGTLMGVFMAVHKRKGPPYGVTEWELEELLAPHFVLNYWGRLRGQESLRQGKELFVYAQKR